MIVILGATGDLTKRKLIPALYTLFRKGVLKRTPIICAARRKLTKKQFIQELKLTKFKPGAKNLNEFYKHIHYFSLDFDGSNEKILLTQNKFSGAIKIPFLCTQKLSFCCVNKVLNFMNNKKEFASYLNSVGKKYKTKERIFYLALPASLFGPTANIIRSSGVFRKKDKIVFEKPFGQDLKSAKELQKKISWLKENNVYRIDHYLGKELTQNIAVFRFANTIFEQIWNNKFIDHVQITVGETVGIGERAGYYDDAGAMRDMIQNHCLQILALTAMEPPKANNANALRDEKVKVFRNLRSEKVILGQYTAGKINGKKVVGYHSEKGIPANSKTDTYAALKLYVDNKRWKGVPFYIRTGKRLKKKVAEINLVLKDVECELFCSKKGEPMQNVITIRIQPNEGIGIEFNSKIPGPGMNLEPVHLEFCHTCRYGMNTPEAYEQLIYSVLMGDQTLFTRWDGVEASWKFVDPILRKRNPLRKYEGGTMGPKEADRMILKDRRMWIESKDITG